jgi:hypothetical protein
VPENHSPDPGEPFREELLKHNRVTVGVWTIGSLAQFPNEGRRKVFFHNWSENFILRSHLTFKDLSTIIPANTQSHPIVQIIVK